MPRDPEVFGDNDDYRRGGMAVVVPGIDATTNPRASGITARAATSVGAALIKLVQLLIRWKAFNLDNLLTT